eukprot:GHRR01037622.1.p1 GENE.GHRR01037622.1~~GHRR01037622.1.p1  ORF type:complete len:105 (-),score=20.14 GHRR01037622.1:183-497(-)
MFRPRLGHAALSCFACATGLQAQAVIAAAPSTSDHYGGVLNPAHSSRPIRPGGSWQKASSGGTLAALLQGCRDQIPRQDIDFKPAGRCQLEVHTRAASKSSFAA